MEILLGFAIAVLISLTGVGGGALTAPLLILCLGLPPTRAVGTALLYIAAVKTSAAPVYLYRGQVDWRALGVMLAGGIPGVLAGTALLSGAATSGLNQIVLGVIGTTVAVSASLTLAGSFTRSRHAAGRWRPRTLGGTSAAIGLSVGFSSSGAGTLGTLALFHFTALPAAAVVGTDLLFGFVLSALAGGLHFAAGAYDAALTLKLIGGGIAGALVGAQTAWRLPARTLRIGILVLLVGLGGHLLLTALATATTTP